MLTFRLEEVRLDNEPQEFTSAQLLLPEGDERGTWRVTFESHEDPMLEPSDERLALVLRAEGHVRLMGTGRVSSVRFVDRGAYVEILGQGELDGVTALGDL